MSEKLITHHADQNDDVGKGVEIHAPDFNNGEDDVYTVTWNDRHGIARSVDLKFQNGTIPENGHNGLTLEILLAIVIHRLAALNAEFPCKENQFAWANFSAGLEWLHVRTRDRRARGVEGKLES